MVEFKPKDLGGRFVLIEDFWFLYRDFSLRQSGAELDINGIREKMHDCLSSAVGRVDRLAVEDLRKLDLPIDRKHDYVVALEGGIIFPDHDYRIEITRACGSLAAAVCGPYLRLSRQFSPLLNQQVLSLASDFGRSNKRFLVLCDDGIGTGGTFKRLIELCRSLSLPVRLVVAITNPEALTNIDGVPVATLDPDRSRGCWLNERDLYWGLPRSGLSVSEPHQFRAIGGVPYTINEKMATERIGIPVEKSARFVVDALTINRLMYEVHEDRIGRQIAFPEIPRLACLRERGAVSTFRVVDGLSELAANQSSRSSCLDEVIN